MTDAFRTAKTMPKNNKANSLALKKDLPLNKRFKKKNILDEK
jgi:hypothetical protein